MQYLLVAVVCLPFPLLFSVSTSSIHIYGNYRLNAISVKVHLHRKAVDCYFIAHNSQ